MQELTTNKDKITRSSVGKKAQNIPTSCTRCGESSKGPIHGHRWGSGVEDRWRVLWLCKPCHRQLHAIRRVDSLFHDMCAQILIQHQEIVASITRAKKRGAERSHIN